MSEIDMKKNYVLLTITVVAIALFTGNASAEVPVKITKLRCEYLENPLGIDVAQLLMSWICESNERGQKQTVYSVLVASSRENLKKE